MAIRVLLVDDHAPFRAAVRALLGLEPDLEVVGEASDGVEAVRLAAELAPDVVLMDVEMPGALRGIEATQAILAGAKAVAPAVIGVSSAEWHEPAMRAAGATAFVAKTRAIELPGAIRATQQR